MKRALIASQALDAGTFALGAALLPAVLAYELNPVIVALVSSVGLWGMVAVKLGVGAFAAFAYGRVRQPSPWLRVLLVVGVVWTLLGALANVVAVAQAVTA